MSTIQRPSPEVIEALYRVVCAPNTRTGRNDWRKPDTAPATSANGTWSAATISLDDDNGCVASRRTPYCRCATLYAR